MRRAERASQGGAERVQVDNHGALEVGHLSEGLGAFKERMLEGSEGYPEVTVRESRLT